MTSYLCFNKLDLGFRVPIRAYFKVTFGMLGLRSIRQTPWGSPMQIILKSSMRLRLDRITDLDAYKCVCSKKEKGYLVSAPQ
jgi:hypothetical protein